MIVMMMYRMKRTGRSSVYLDTGAKPGHAMLRSIKLEQYKRVSRLYNYLQFIPDLLKVW